MLFLFLHLLNEWHEHELTVYDTRVIPEQEIVLLAQIHRWVGGQDTTWDPATVSAHRKSWTKSFIFLFCAIPVQVAPRPYSIQTLGYIYTPHPVHLFRFLHPLTFILSCKVNSGGSTSRHLTLYLLYRILHFLLRHIYLTALVTSYFDHLIKYDALLEI